MEEHWEANLVLSLPWSSRRQVLTREVLRYLPLIVRIKGLNADRFRLQALRAAITLAVVSTRRDIGTFEAYRAFYVEVDQNRLLRNQNQDDILSVDRTLARSSAFSILDALDATAHSDVEKIKHAIDPFSFG